MKDIRGSPDKTTSFGVFFPKYPSCEVAPIMDGWCHHIDAPHDPTVMQSKYGNRKDYCGFLVCEGLCPLAGERA